MLFVDRLPAAHACLTDRALQVAAEDGASNALKVAKAIVKEEECDSGMFVVKKDFQIIFSTTFGYDDYKEFLDGCGRYTAAACTTV
eukprot:SAG22_NODE_2566_length_2434_cov_1.406852_3_plen_86_part_00